MDTKIKQILINNEELETRVALLINGKLEEYHVERRNDKVAELGSIYLGRVSKNEKSIQASFIDIGTEKNSFLQFKNYLKGQNKSAEEIEVEEETTKTKLGFGAKIRSLLTIEKKTLLKRIEDKKKKIEKTDQIPQIFNAGSELLVQVTKGPIGTKGAQVTTQISIPGKFLVLVPYSKAICLSKKITSKTERKRLKKILTKLDIPKGFGVICRTAGEGRKEAYFKRDLDILLDKWHSIEEQSIAKNVPLKVYQEPGVIEKVARDLLTDDIDSIIADNKEDFDYLQDLAGKFVGNEMVNKVKFYDRAKPIFDHYYIRSQINQITNRIVRLKSGGYICLDETEALIAIDVNSGSSRKFKNFNETILNTNLEAAAEVARQLRLRNIGGIVVVDFIDMSRAKDREAVLNMIKKCVKDDRARVRFAAISKFGLMEMTRQREHESLKDLVSEACPYCSGRGNVKSAISMSVEIQRMLQGILKRNKDQKFEAKVIMHPTILERLKNKDAELFTKMEKLYGGNLSFRGDNDIHLEEFKVIDVNKNEELKY